MPDIDPAALSRPANLSTPVLSTKTLNITAPGSVKISKSQTIPQRIDLEPLYTALKAVIIPEHWVTYKEATTEFLIGKQAHSCY
jgi:transcriptional coactivator HFI1/ADA1